MIPSRGLTQAQVQVQGSTQRAEGGIDPAHKGKGTDPKCAGVEPAG